MKRSAFYSLNPKGLLCACGIFLLVAALAGCGQGNRIRVQGYVEGEFVYVSSALSGPLQDLKVYRGTEVKAGDPLFELDRAVEKAALELAQAELTFTEQDLKRQELLSLTPGTASVRDLQLARSTRDQDDRRLAEAQWNYAQKAQVAPQTGVVFDTLYRQGEWVDAGHPVVQILPPANIEVRAFVPQRSVGTLHVGDEAKIFIDGVGTPFNGKLRFIFPEAEYTPPVIYSQESREKLVFMVEIDFDPDTAKKLHPGQPVDVEFDH